MAFVEDLDPFFDTGDFGVTATYNGSTPVNGIFDNGFLASAGGEAGVEGSAPSFTCKASDVAGVQQGHTLAISSVTYKISGVHPDGTGVVVLVLRKSS